MTRGRCVNPEPIPQRWGGGHLCTCVCGRPRLHGKAWSWWRCPVCVRAESTAGLRARQRTLMELYYPEGAR